MNSSNAILWCGIASYATGVSYSAGLSATLVSSVFFVPVAVLVAVLRSRAKRKKIEEQALSNSARALGIWLLASTLVGAVLITRPGREASGMFGGLFFVWPIAVSLVSCLILAWWLPSKSVTYNR